MADATAADRPLACRSNSTVSSLIGLSHRRSGLAPTVKGPSLCSLPDAPTSPRRRLRTFPYVFTRNFCHGEQYFGTSHAQRLSLSNLGWIRLPRHASDILREPGITSLPCQHAMNSASFGHSLSRANDDLVRAVHKTQHEHRCPWAFPSA